MRSAAHLAFSISMIFVTILLAFAFDGSLYDIIFPRGSWDTAALSADLGLGVAVGLAAVLLSRFSEKYLPFFSGVQSDFQQMVGMDEARGVLLYAAMSALAEELLFRGFLQNHLGLCATSLLFGVTHIPRSWHQLPWTLSAIALGFILGELYVVRGSLLTPFCAHFLLNHFNMHHLLRPRCPEEMAQRCVTKKRVMGNP